jgi:nitroreductase/NAD-dependent dihydropyrimidine dehydrogenase PreA subunit
MPILGINYEKCTECASCEDACPRGFFERSEEKGRMVFQDPKRQCALCGQCIAQCPEDAIIYKNMGESFSFDGVEKPETIVSYESILNFMKAQRSIRHYKNEKVSREVLKKVLVAMQFAPTAQNNRSENYLVLSDEEKLKALSDAVEKELLMNPATKAIYADSFAISEKRYKIPIYFDAPHVIFVSSGLNIQNEDNTIGIIVTYGRLAAQTLGLGTCWNGWTQFAMSLNPKLRDLVGIRGEKIGVFTMGYPDVTYYRTSPRIMKPVKGLE